MKKHVFKAIYIVALYFLAACSSSTTIEHQAPLAASVLPAPLPTEVHHRLKAADENLEEEEYIHASVDYRSAYEMTGQAYAYLRYTEAIALWSAYRATLDEQPSQRRLTVNAALEALDIALDDKSHDVPLGMRHREHAKELRQLMQAESVSDRYLSAREAREAQRLEEAEDVDDEEDTDQ